LLIEIDHPNFSSIELRGQTLIVHSMQAGPRVLRENVQDAAVVAQGSVVQIMAFLNADYAWFFRGQDELHSERLELGQSYGGGGRLIQDGLGRCHLFYFVRPSPGPSCLLCHHHFTDAWSGPQTVSANVFGEPWGFSVSWHSDQYLHLAYLAHKDRRLLYRVYDLEHGLWSGAVTFSEASCAHPHFVSAGPLHLFWLEELEQTMLKARHKTEHWSAPISLSTGRGHAGSVGFSHASGQWSVLWGEGSDFYQVPFGRWEERRAVERGDFEYVWKVQGGLTLPVYKGKQQMEAKEEAQPQEEARPEVQEEKKQLAAQEQEAFAQRLAEERSRQARAQAAFMEQAFRTLKEWEEVKEEIRVWRREWKPPQPVDLTPLTTRLDRLERRVLSLKQAQEEERLQGETGRAQLERELLRLRARLEELELQQKAKPRSFWWRVLGRA